MFFIVKITKVIRLEPKELGKNVDTKIRDKYITIDADAD